jgi:hypothetical protein
MNSKLLAAMAIFAMVASTPAFAGDDCKAKECAKKIGKGVMWGPKKVASATKKGAQAMGRGAKKVIGKD